MKLTKKYLLENYQNRISDYAESPAFVLSKEERKILHIEGHKACGCDIYYLEDYPWIRKE